ncbi:MAG: hypothetical protein J6M05_04325 [Cardiobacteriaceae bacterium]|nr:hypothetical protein [Cardiobacteriaceae bacterium]
MNNYSINTLLNTEKSNAKTPSEYLAIGREVIKNGTAVQYSYKNEIRNGYVQYLGNNSKNGNAKFIFVGTNSNGNITTIHIKSGKDMWKTLNGDPKNKTIYPSKGK